MAFDDFQAELDRMTVPTVPTGREPVISLSESLTSNPDIEAKKQILGPKVGAAPALMDDDALKEAEETERLRKFNEISKTAPKFKDWLRWGDNARVAHDDIETLGKLEADLSVVGVAGPEERKTGQRAKSVVRAFTGGVKSAPDRAGESLAGLGLMGAEYIEYVLRPFPDDTGMRKAVVDAVRESKEFWKRNAEIRSPQKKRGTAEYYLQQSGASIGLSLAAAPYAVAAPGAALAMFGLTAGDNYDELRESGYGPAYAGALSLAARTMEGLTEKIGFDKIGAGKGPVIEQAVKFVFGDLAGEEVNTLYSALQDKITIQPDMTMKDVVQQVIDTAIVTAIAGPVQGVGMASASKVSEGLYDGYMAKVQADNARNFMTALGESAQSSKLRARLPEKFQELVAKIKEGGPVENVFIPAEQWTTYWQSQNIDPAQQAQELGVEYAEAAQTGGDVVIPLEVYAAQLAATEHHGSLMQDARLRQGEPTAREAEAMQAEWQEEIDLLNADMAAQEGEATTARPSYLSVFDDIYGQMQGIGYDRKTAEQVATLTAVRAKRRADVLGLDAWELYQERPLAITRPLPEGVRRQTVDMGVDPLLDRLRAGDIPDDATIFGPSLLQFVRERGVKDDRGDLRSMEVDAARKPGQRNIIRPDGLALDKLREAAVEAGYLDDESTTADLLAAIDDELRGNQVYSSVPVDRQAFDTRAALDQFREYLDQVGIDYQQMDNAAIRAQLDQGENVFLEYGIVDPGGYVNEEQIEFNFDEVSPEGTGADVDGRLLSGENPDDVYPDGRVSIYRQKGSSIPRRIKAELSAQVDSVQTGTFRIGLSKIESAKDAAHVFASLRKKSKENFVSLVLGENSEPLAVLDVSTGGPRSAVVDAMAFAGAILDVPGAKSVWFGHNHPSGNPRPSPEDLAITEQLGDLLNGSGVASEGHVVIGAGGAFSAMRPDGPLSVTGQKATPAARNMEIPLVDQRFFYRGSGEAVTDSASAASFLSGRGSGVLMLNAKNIPVAWVPMSESEMKTLRVGDIDKGSGLLLRAVSQSGGQAMIVKVENQSGVEGAKNVMRFGNRLNVRPLDFLIGESPLSNSIAVPSDVKFFQSLPEKMEVDGVERWTVNSDGAPIHSTEEGIRSFWRWFGDSQAVDDQGRPLVVYHGSPDARFMAEDGIFRGRNEQFFGRVDDEAAHWFSDTKRTAGSYADERRAFDYQNAEPGIVPAFIRMTNPLIIDAGGAEWSDAQRRGKTSDVIREAREAGNDGVLIRNVKDDYNNGKASRAATTFTVFTSEQIKSATENAGTFDPNNRSILWQNTDTKRGFYRPETNTIGILEKADLSTFIHELSHSWLEELKEDAARPDAPDQLRKDWEIIAGWLGATDSLTVDQHEQFARGGEAYVMEGKAPVAELQPVFQRFKAWLTRIYRTLRNLNVQLNDDVRGVFDRLLASEDEIAVARQGQRLAELFATKEEAGMTEAEFAAYRKSAESAHAAEVERLQSKMMKELQRENEAWWKKARESVREEVQSEAENAPVYRAIRLLTTGKLFDGSEGPSLKMNRADLVRMYGEPFLKRLPRGFGRLYANEGGLHPDVVADMFGFDSGEAMIQAMVEAPTMKQWVEGETDIRMRATHGDMLLDGSAADEAQAAVHGALRGDVLLAELRALRKQRAAARPALRAQEQNERQARRDMNAAIPQREAFELAAAQMIGSKEVGKLDVRGYLAAERKAAKESFDAVSKKQWDKAAEAKRKQVMNFYLFREATKAQEQVDGYFKLFDKLAKGNKDLAKTRDVNMVSAARAILERYGVQSGRGDVFGYLRKIQEQDPETYNDLMAAVDAATAQAKPWKTLTLDEMGALFDAVSSLWNLARRSKQIEIDGKMIGQDEMIDALVSRIDELGGPKSPPGVNQAITKGESFSAALVGLRAAMTRIEAWVDAMDGGKPGVFRRYIWQPVVEAIDNYRVQKKAVMQKYLDLVKAVEPSVHHDQIDARRYINYKFDGKGELLGALLHTGNESNKRKLLVGRGWGFIAEDGGLDSTAWDRMISDFQARGVLTKADYDFIQGTWDLFEEIKGPAQNTHKELYGYYFDEITHQEFDTPWGTYRGGYAPALVDSNLNADAEMREQREQLEGAGNAYMFPTAGRGFTRGRVEYNKPLVIDLRLVPSHIDKVLRFTHIEPRAKDIGRALLNPRLRDVLNGYNPSAINAMLMPWIQRAASQQVENRGARDRGQAAFNTFLRELRSRSGMQVMVLNVANTIQQFTGAVLASVKISPKYLAGATVRYLAHPSRTAEEINAKSKMMQTRIMQSVFDMQQGIDRVLVKPTVYQSVKDFAVKHSYFLQAMTQHVVDVITWSGAYDQAIAQGLDERMAVRAADSAVRMTQGSFNAEDLSRAEAGTPFMRAVTQFYSYFNMQANLLGSAAVGSIRDKGAVGSMPNLLRIYSAFALTAITSEAIMMAMRGGPDDDDDLADILMELLVLSQIRTAGAFIPFGGNLTNYMIDRASPDGWQNNMRTVPGLAMIESAGRTATLPIRIAADGSVNERQAVKDLLTTIGMVTGLPVAPLGRPLGYMIGVEQGTYQQPDNPADAARGLIHGTGPRN